jgi:hypothetical protein
MFQAADDKQLAGALEKLMKFLEHKEPVCR